MQQQPQLQEANTFVPQTISHILFVRKSSSAKFWLRLFTQGGLTDRKRFGRPDQCERLGMIVGG